MRSEKHSSPSTNSRPTLPLVSAQVVGHSRENCNNFCMALFSGLHKLTARYSILQHFLSEKKEEKSRVTCSRFVWRHSLLYTNSLRVTAFSNIF